jgi:adenylate cyclase
MVAAIFEHGGTLDKFIGDGIMATFGTPRPAPDDAQRAVAAALSMLDRLDGLNNRFHADGLPELKIGIGIHSGPAIVGNIGTSARLEYTVIGDTVNTASRLESACKETGDPLLVSRAVADQLTVAVEPRGEAVLRGKKAVIALFAVPRKQA